MSRGKSKQVTEQDKFRVAAKTRLIELGTTVTELASHLGVSRIAVSQAINHGLHRPTLERVAAHLELPL